MSETLVLSVGLDRVVLDARETVLRSAGYIVVSAMSIEEAIHVVRDGDFDLMVLCHTLPVRDQERLTSFIRASGSRIPVASISGAPGDQSAFSDATIEQSPVEFLEGLKCLLAMRFEIAASEHRGTQQTAATPSTPRIQTSDNHFQPEEFRFPHSGTDSPRTLSRAIDLHVVPGHGDRTQ